MDFSLQRLMAQITKAVNTGLKTEEATVLNTSSFEFRVSVSSAADLQYSLGKIRIACQAFHIHRIMKPRLNEQTWLIQYLCAGHKTLRWFTIFSLLATAVFGTVFLSLTGFGWVAATGWIGLTLTVVLGFSNVNPSGQLLDGLLALVANGVGVIESLNGKVYQTWVSPKSARQSR